MTTLQEARIASKLTQAEAARLLHVPKRTYEDWEYGRRNPRKGSAYYAELVKAFGVFSPSGRESIIDGALTEDQILGIYRVECAKRISKWGRYGTTWERAFDRIPDCIYPSLTAEGIAALVDAFVECYSDGKSAK